MINSLYKTTSLCLVGLALAFSPSKTRSQSLPSSAPVLAPLTQNISSQIKAPSLTPQEAALYQQIAKRAWPYLDKHYSPSTGFVQATPDWAGTTLWDIGGQLIAYQAALELGLISKKSHAQKISKTLKTLEHIPLYSDIAFNRVYSTATGRPDSITRGWSATDLGRLFIALKIVSAHNPKMSPQINRIIARNKISHIVKNGYLQGQDLNSRNQPVTFQEGRIGYEQYAAKGLSLWGASVAQALDLNQNAIPVKVLGVDLVADARWDDRLVSEPFILYGLEIGWPPELRNLATNLLKVQEARYIGTGQITMTSEDALSIPPSYFYYYCIYCNRTPFSIQSSAGQLLDSPRWVSTKAALGWHALLPNPYTKKASELVMAKSWDPRLGFASGLMESNGISTKTYDINTAAVLMEIAWYKLMGSKPLLPLSDLAK